MSAACAGGGTDVNGGIAQLSDDEVELSEDESSEETPPAPPVSTGFKLNLSGVAPNEVDDKKPEAIPHTPKQAILDRLAAEGKRHSGVREGAGLVDGASIGPSAPRPAATATPSTQPASGEEAAQVAALKAMLAASAARREAEEQEVLRRHVPVFGRSPACPPACAFTPVCIRTDRSGRGLRAVACGPCSHTQRRSLGRAQPSARADSSLLSCGSSGGQQQRRR